MTRLERICSVRNVKIEALSGAAEKSNPDMPNNWRVKLTMHNQSFSCDFYGGSAVTKVSAADVISSLCSDARAGEQTFEEFCSEFGYDTDSRKARNTWKACKYTSARFRAFLGNFFDEFANAEH